MADEPTPLSHEGAWTEDAYLALDTAGSHVELIDGSLLVGPTHDDRHAHAVAVVRAAVAAALPDGLEVTGPVALRLSPGRILVPDLVVAASSGSVAGEVRDSSVALAVIDVVGAGNGVADRWFKPQLYAGSRIPYALLVDHDDPFAVGNMLIGGRYHEYASAEGDGVLRLEEPFVLELDLTALAAPGSGDPAPGDPAAFDPAAFDPAAGPDAADSTRGSAEGEPSGSEPDAGELTAGPPGAGVPGAGPLFAVEPGAGMSGTGEPGAGESAAGKPVAGEPGAQEPGAVARSGRGFDAGEVQSGAGENGARVNGAETGTPPDGSTDPAPHRSHPDEDHSVHA